MHPGNVKEFEFEVPVDSYQKCTEFKPFKFHGKCLLPHCGKSKKTSPHMRAFWAATLAFMIAFIGWFAFAPLMTVVRKDIGLCDNDAEVQLDMENTKCICKQECKRTLGNAQMASVSFDVFTRFILGSVIEKFGPKNTDVMLLLVGAVFCSCGFFVTNGTGLIIVRFFVSCLGSTFVVNQFWNSIMFSKEVVGTANATAGGWGNLGGGITQSLMPLVYRFFLNGVGLEITWAWRAAMLFPPVVFLILAAWIYTCTQDTTVGKFDVTILGKTTKAGPMTYLKCLADVRVFLMIFQYSACFGCELVMNNTLATHFQDYFGVDIVAAGALATCFGGMNLFARSLGGGLSDWCNQKWGMQGRLWAHFISLFGQAVFLFLFGCVTSDMGWAVALPCVCILSTFVNMAEGTSYAIVPYMIPEQLPVVSAMVGAGGTLGAVIATRLCYMTTEDELLPYRLHAGYVLFWALSVFAMRWENLGSMFSGAKQQTPGHLHSRGSLYQIQEVTAYKAGKEKEQTAPDGIMPAQPSLQDVQAVAGGSEPPAKVETVQEGMPAQPSPQDVQAVEGGSEQPAKVETVREGMPAQPSPQEVQAVEGVEEVDI